MKIETYWNAYLKAGYRYRLFFDRGLDYKKCLRQYYKFREVLITNIRRLDELEKQGMIDGGGDA